MFKKILLGTSLLCAAAVSNAAIMTDTQSASVSLSLTDWTQTVTVGDFNTSLGNLLSVEVKMTGSIEGTITVTNTGPSVANVEGTLAANISYAFGALTGSVSPTDTRTSVLNARSVLEFLDLADTKVDSQAPMSLGVFTDGIANSFDISAAARSTAFGAGNASTGFVTNASALIEIIYTYDTGTVTPPPVSVSAPSHLALLGLGLVGFAGARRLRK